MQILPVIALIATILATTLAATMAIVSYESITSREQGEDITVIGGATCGTWL